MTDKENAAPESKQVELEELTAQKHIGLRACGRNRQP